MKYIWMPISKGLFTLIDSDNQTLFEKPWFAHKNKMGKFYACRNKPSSNGKRPSGFLHLGRLILDCPEGFVADHINGNTLDNRRCNLRIATKSENNANTQKVGKIKGVRRRSDSSWGASIKVNYKKIHLGSYATEQEAALAYNVAAIKYFGEYACLNFLSSQAV